MMDAYTPKLAFICALELKEPNGRHLEAKTQLATLHAAILLKRKDLMHDTRVITKIPALIG